MSCGDGQMPSPREMSFEDTWGHTLRWENQDAHLREGACAPCRSHSEFDDVSSDRLLRERCGQRKASTPVSERGTGRNSVAAFSAVRSWCNGLVGLRFPHAPVSRVAGASQKWARWAPFDTRTRALSTSIARSSALGALVPFDVRHARTILLDDTAV